MALALTVTDYLDYLALAAARIHENGDYVTGLDLATGDGDHWTNLDMGFRKLLATRGELEGLALADCFKRIGMLMMSSVGGSAGVLYGSAYIGAAKALKDKESLALADLATVLDAMLQAIMARGSAKPGDKTMIDSLHPAVVRFQECLAQNLPAAETLASVKQAANDGAAATADMEAMRGRAFYQANKGKGHLDPGAVTMAYQIETLMDFAAGKLAQG